MPNENHLLAATPRTQLKRRANHGRRDRATINAIIDQSLVCHVGFIEDNMPVVVPTSPWRVGDWLYVHGAASSRWLAHFSGGVLFGLQY